MNWLDWICLVALSLLCNTSLPFSFDPVLIHFASRQFSGPDLMLALSAAAGAGLGAVVDVKFLRWLERKVPPHWIGWLPHWKGRRFYLLTFVVAMSPLPFSIVRLAALRGAPRSIPYGLAVFLGRAPRYLLTIALWPALGLPPYASLILLCVVLFAATVKLLGPTFLRSIRASG